jgi:hypothetical protein
MKNYDVLKNINSCLGVSEALRFYALVASDNDALSNEELRQYLVEALKKSSAVVGLAAEDLQRNFL